MSEKSSSDSDVECVDVVFVRYGEEAALRVMAKLAQGAGASSELLRPGRVMASFPCGMEVVITVAKRNPFKGEAAAYLLRGEAVPEQVSQDLRAWEDAHNPQT